MLYYQLRAADRTRLLVHDDETAYDLTSADASVTSFTEIARRAARAVTDIDAAAAELLESADSVSLADQGEAIDRPLDPGEVWAAGVTYRISEEARMAESGMPEIYLNVYDAERPELFMKATASRTVGPGDAVGIRSDSGWDVPEPELGIVLYEGEIVGYTIGNDMSSREIEGENPLYLPQAKIYARCCAIGPAIASPATVGDPHDLEMGMRIEREGRAVFDERTSTSEMVRTCEELVSYWGRHNTVPEIAVLLTGTSLVPEDDFTLAEGDVITIEIEGLGTLTNPVIRV